MYWLMFIYKISTFKERYLSKHFFTHTDKCFRSSINFFWWIVKWLNVSSYIYFIITATNKFKFKYAIFYSKSKNFCILFCSWIIFATFLQFSELINSHRILKEIYKNIELVFHWQFTLQIGVFRCKILKMFLLRN